MTWHTHEVWRKFPGRSAAAGLGTLLALVGCGSDTTRVSLVLTRPAPDQELTLAEDDGDPDRAGLQFDVSGSSRGVRQGTSVHLFIDDERQSATARIDERGDVVMPDVTLPPGTHTIYFETSTGSVGSDKEQQYTLKAIEIVSPTDGLVLTREDDEDTNQAGTQISVQVRGYAIDLDEPIALLLDGTSQGTEDPDAEGRAAFTGITLTQGTHRLSAVSGDGAGAIASAEIEIELREGCAAVTFVQPGPPTAGETSVVLGGTNACPAAGEPFQTTVRVATDAGNGRPAKLFVNGQQVASETVSGATVTFADVTLTGRESGNMLRVEVENSEGMNCSEDFPVPVAVDCAGPDCAITSPSPVAFVDGSGSQTLYVNASMADANGVDVSVESSGEALGETVQLIVDRDVGDPLAVTAQADGMRSLATFDAVALGEGTHRVEALCRDAAGNITSSGEQVWEVDLTACGLSLTAPAASSSFVPADDEDASSTGTQVVLSSTVTGSDCVGQRAAPCDPASGIDGVEFVPYAGASPLLSTVTLGPEGNQTLCVELEDRAGNVGSASVAVSYRETAPRVLIESPANNAKYNAAGGAGYTVDVDQVTSPAACDADFSVACTELGRQVELRRDGPTGAIVGMGECAARVSTDPALPAGYSGRAKFRGAFDETDGTAVLVATQTITGSSAEVLIGQSTALTLQGDCRVPTLLFTNDPCGTTSSSGQLTLADAAARDVIVFDAAADTMTASLALMRGAVTGAPIAPTSSTANQSSWDNVDLGAAGTVTLIATVVDEFANSATLSCTTTIVSDLPTVTFTAPANNAVLDPGAACDTGSAGEYGVRVQATADMSANRTATISVNGGTPINVAIGGGGVIDACVPVPDDLENTVPGPSTITLRVSSTVGGGFAEHMHLVSVRTLLLADPTDGRGLRAGDNDNCSGTGFSMNVVANVAFTAHIGETFRLVAGTSMATGIVSGAQVSGCLELAEGPNVITASIVGTSVMRSVNVTVVSQPPAQTILIDDPAAPDPLDADYRDGPVRAAWTKPTQLFTGQLVRYELRCRHVELLMSATTNQKDNWWIAAQSETLPVALTPDDDNPFADFAFRGGDARHCVVRAFDAADQGTVIGRSTDLTLALRERVLAAGTGASQLGFAVAAAGDVDNDGFDDILAGGRGRAELIFGATNPANAKRVVFLGTGTGVGQSIAGIGDFNGDGFDDFAIGDIAWTGFRGRVSIFFGRPQAQWPTTDLNLENACEADLCLDGDAGAVGVTLAAVGNFDGALPARMDLAIGSPFYPTFANDGQLLIVLGADYTGGRACTPATQATACRASEACTGNGNTTCAPTATFWKMRFDLPSGNWSDPPSGGPVARLRGFRLDSEGALTGLGTAIASLGTFDTAPGADLAVSTPHIGEVQYLSGRAHSGLVQFDMLSGTDLGLRDDLGDPDGMPMATGSSTDLFGAIMATPGDLYTPAGSASPAVDLAVGESLTNEFFVLPGDPLAAMDPGFGATAVNVRDIVSNSFGTGLHPSYGLLGDLDFDGKGELLVGTYTRQVALWYPDRFAAAVSSNTVLRDTASISSLAASASDSADFNVQFVGDFNGDGHPDLCVGDNHANTDQGQAVLLY